MKEKKLVPEPVAFVDTFWCMYIVSVMAAINAEIVTYPLDLIKTRLQIQGEQATKLGKIDKTQYRGMVRTGLGIVKEEGLFKLWNGVGAVFLRHAVYAGTRMIIYKKMKEELFKSIKGTDFPIWQSVFCGATAGGFAQFVSSPMELVKVQLQMEGKRRLIGMPPRLNGIADGFKKAWASGGIVGLWRGAVPNIQRAVLVNIGDLSSYDIAKRYILKQTSLPDSYLVHGLSSTVAGFVAAVLATPADVVKARMMNQPFDEQGRGLNYRSSVECWYKTISDEGVIALYKGFLPLWIRLAPWAVIFWMSYEKIENLIGGESFLGSDDKATRFVPTSRIKKLLKKRLHILQWLPHYTKNDILADFIAGLTVGLTMMPQSIAYAGLAGISPEYGLYTAFIGSFTYVFFGTIKEVSIGPTSLMSLLTFSYIFPHPIEYVILLTFIAGCVEFLMGVLKLGFLVDFISPCLTSGFTTASAVIIVVAQLKHLLGIKIKSHDTFSVFIELSKNIADIKWQDTLLGFSCLLFLFCFKQLTKIPSKSRVVKKLLWFLSISKNALIVLITSLIGAYLHYNGGAPFKLTGPVPKGMPHVGFPALSAKIGNETTVGYSEMITSLGSGIVVIPVVAVLANVAIAKSYSAEVVVDASQEMMTLGLCNIFGSFVKAMPSCGAFTRSAVASTSDVRTPLQGIYSGSVIILALSLLAEYFYFIPRSTLAAVLITAGSSLIDYEIFPVLWKCNKVDFFLTLMTFIVGVVKGVETAIVIGCILNALILLKSWSRPNISVEIRTSKETNKDFIYVRPELGLFYPAADYVSEAVKKAHNQTPKISIVVDCANIIKLDYSAAKMLENLLNTYNQKEIVLCLINVNQDILKTLKTVTDTSYLELCKSTDSIPHRTLETYKSEHELPLLKISSRKSSMRSERRLSLYDLE